MGILREDEAWQEYIDWQEQDKKTLRRIKRLVKIYNGILLKAWGIRNRCRGFYQGGGAGVLTRKTVLYTNLREGIQQFFHVKSITGINHTIWLGIIFSASDKGNSRTDYNRYCRCEKI